MKRVLLVISLVFFTQTVNAFVEQDKAKVAIDSLINATKVKIESINKTLSEVTQNLDLLVGDKGLLNDLQSRNADLKDKEVEEIKKIYITLRTLFSADIPLYKNIKVPAK